MKDCFEFLADIIKPESCIKIIVDMTLLLSHLEFVALVNLLVGAKILEETNYDQVSKETLQKKFLETITVFILFNSNHG